MDEVTPKVVGVKNVANDLALTFDDGQVRYLQTHYARDLVKSFQVKAGKGHRKMLLTSGMDAWLGTDVDIRPDGTVVLNGTDTYTPQELWQDSKTEMY